MTNNFRGYQSVDELIERTPLDVVLGHYGLPITKSGASEHRMNCVFTETCSTSTYGNLAISLDAAKRIYCHTCQTKGNLLTLLHGLEHHRPPEGGRLRGQEFKEAVAKLKEITGQGIETPNATRKTASQPQSHSPQRKESVSPEAQASGTSSTPPATVSAAQPSIPAAFVNVPLRRHEKEAARELANLFEDLIVDVSQMSPEAAAYVRKRPWMTPELMRKWGCGWIPGNGRSLFRKNYFVYTHRNVRGDVISYSGRDLTFEKKWEQWLRDGKPESKKPSKHRFVAGYHRGVELYGSMASRLEEPQLRESLAENGLVVVEGMNDVIRLDELGICAVGLCSNRATDTQIESISKFANQVANGKVQLFPDADPEGEAGFKELLWGLNKYGNDVGIVTLKQTKARQPEDICDWN